MIKRVFRGAILSILACLALASFTAFGQPNGIYADFTTSMGSFTCKLEYATAPKATASFIGLATGLRSWLDLNTGKAKTNAFYNGLTFHRVVADFVIQGGSPNGQGTDGPGYAFTDEISAGLNFNNAFMLAMANSGTNSNGSQFFITTTPRPALNNGYTIFGQLVGGTNVVLAINQVAVQNEKPLTNVYIQNIGIRRIGSAAQAFNIHAQNLPTVTNVSLRIAASTTNVSLTFSNRMYADNRLYSSTNLGSWSGENLGIEISSAGTNRIFRGRSKPAEFYSMAQIQYPSSTFAPKAVSSRMLTLNFGGSLIVISFNGSDGGTYTYTGNPPGTVTEYYWFQEPYRGRLLIAYSGLVDMDLTLNFANATSGTFRGTAYTLPFPSAVSGTFTLN